MILAIDPAPKSSAWVTYDGDLQRCGQTENIELLNRIEWDLDDTFGKASHMVIEDIVSYGRPIGQTTLETKEWVGIYRHAFGLDRAFKMPRVAVKTHLCHNGNAKDSWITQALKDRWIERTGIEKPWLKSGPLYPVRQAGGKHVWQALGLAVTWWEIHREEIQGS